MAHGIGLAKCGICGKPTESVVDERYGVMYHLECLKNDPKMVETRKRTQEACPHKVKKDV